MSWHEDVGRRGIDSDTSLDFDDIQSNHQGKVNLLHIYV